jgi:hypothetical protein
VLLLPPCLIVVLETTTATTAADRGEVTFILVDEIGTGVEAVEVVVVGKT